MTTLSTPPRRATMRDVAALAGVSLKTVSRVVNGEPGVSDDLAERVNRAASQLAYQHNLAASNLRRASGRTATLGLVLEDVANPYSAVVYRAVEDTARKHGVAVFAASMDEDAEQQDELVSTFIARRVDGLIIAPAGNDHSFIASQARAGLPVVFVDRPGSTAGFDAVVSDNEEGARVGVAHLIAHGHTRIAFIGDLPQIPTAELRYRGFLDAFAAAGLDVDDALVVRGVHEPGEGTAAVASLFALPSPPTAIFSAQNIITIEVVKALQRAGLSESIALVGFDDFPLADAVNPPVTVLAQDLRRIGELATEVVFSRIDGDTSPTQTHVVPTTLIVRGSGEIRP